MVDVLGGLPSHDLELEQTRGSLIVTVPELRARFMDELAETIRMIAEAIAERIDRDPGRFVVRNFVGAVIGVALAAVIDLADQPDADYLAAFDRGLAHLDAGLPL